MARQHPTDVVQRAGRALEFNAPAGFAGFVLTCLEEPDCGRGSALFRECLNRVFIRTRPNHEIHVRVVAERRVLAPLAQMAVANGGKVHSLSAMKDDYAQTDIFGFLRRIRLRPAPTRIADAGRFLLALWGCDNELFRSVLLYLNEISVAECEVAFVQRGASLPSHLVLIHESAHMDA